jgi:tetratricopeptide (TPR) repeat protein
VAVDSAQCSYCRNPVHITTFGNVWSLSDPVVGKYLASYQADLATGKADGTHLALGLCYLKLKLYDQAKTAFERALPTSIGNSEAYFYAAVSCLRGKKPFVGRRADIDNALQYAHAARMIDARSVYDYLLAYIKYDFFERKGYRITPTYRDELTAAKSKGLAAGDLKYLRDLLTVDPVIVQ